MRGLGPYICIVLGGISPIRARWVFLTLAMHQGQRRGIGPSATCPHLPSVCLQQHTSRIFSMLTAHRHFHGQSQRWLRLGLLRCGQTALPHAVWPRLVPTSHRWLGAPHTTAATLASLCRQMWVGRRKKPTHLYVCACVCVVVQITARRGRFVPVSFSRCFTHSYYESTCFPCAELNAVSCPGESNLNAGVCMLCARIAYDRCTKQASLNFPLA